MIHPEIKSREPRPRNLIFPIIALSGFCVVLYLMLMFTLQIDEDMEYSMTGYLRQHGLSDDYNFQGMWNHIIYMYQKCNGRLIDKLSVPMLVVVPRWLASLINVGVVLSIIAASYKIIALAIGGTYKSKPLSSSWFAFMRCYPWYAVAFVFLMMMFFRWDCKMHLIDYMLNYLWTSATALWIMYYFCNPRLIGGAAWKFVAMLIFGIVAGMMHEVVACVLCSAFVSPAMCSENRRVAVRRFLIIASVFAGFLILNSAPAQSYRVGYTDMKFNLAAIFAPEYHRVIPRSSVMPVVLFFLIVCVYSVYSMQCISWGGIKRFFALRLSFRRSHGMLWTIVAITAVGCIVSTVMYAIFYAPRLMSLAILLSFCGGLSVLACWPERLPHWFCCVLKCSVVLTGLCGFVVWGFSIVVQYELRKSFDKFTEQVFASDSDTVYADRPALWWEDSQVSSSPFPWQMLNPLYTYYTSLNYDPLRPPRNLVIVPECFRNLEDDNTIEEVINCEIPPKPFEWIDRENGILSYGKYYLYTNPNGIDYNPADGRLTEVYDIGGLLKVNAVFDDGSSEVVRFRVARFTAPKSGAKIYLLQPVILSPTPLKHRIVSVSDVENIVREPIRIYFSSFGKFDCFPNEPDYNNFRVKEVAPPDDNRK